MVQQYSKESTPVPQMCPIRKHANVGSENCCVFYRQIRTPSTARLFIFNRHPISQAGSRANRSTCGTTQVQDRRAPNWLRLNASPARIIKAVCPNLVLWTILQRWLLASLWASACAAEYQPASPEHLETESGTCLLDFRVTVLSRPRRGVSTARSASS